MQEEADRLLDVQLPQFGTQRQEVIILNPEGRVGLAEAQQRARHESVDFAIGAIVLSRSADQIGTRMQRRP